MLCSNKLSVVILLCIFSIFSGSTFAQEAKDKTGNWLMYWGTNRVSKRVSIWTEAQYRLYEVASNRDQLLLRTGLIYHLQNGASLIAGYAYVKTWPFDESITNAVTGNENRLWEQFILKNNLWRLDFEHRYRLEQRWVKTEVTEYSTRMRYRLLLLLPLNKENLKPETFFFVTYNEIFLNINGGETFDQNRLYFALGYQFSSIGQIQAGYLFQMLPKETLTRLQFAFVYNLDLRNN
jgi:hypothetical protein